MSVFALFNTTQDGDGYEWKQLVGLYTTEEKAISDAKLLGREELTVINKNSENYTGTEEDRNMGEWGGSGVRVIVHELDLDRTGLSLTKSFPFYKYD